MPTPTPVFSLTNRRAFLLIALCGVGAYFNSLWGVFVFDDLTAIVANPHLEHLWPPTRPGTDSLRPVLFYTLALNRAVSGLEVWSYHAVNIAVHLLAACALYTLTRHLLPRAYRGYTAAAPTLALALALLWAVHPLQTQSVTYIIQRGESMAGLCYLLVLYGTLRGAESDRPYRWYGAVFVAYVLGLGSKEWVATAPLAVLCLDLLLLPGRWYRRWGLYLTLVAPLLAAGLWWLLTYPDMFGLLTGDSEKGGPLDYARTQPGVLLYYLRLALWPYPLCIDYAWPLSRDWAAAAPATAVVLGALATCCWGLYRRRPWAFPGLLFFFVLLPTSSFVALRDPLVEHRMYLPLAPVLLAPVLGVHAWSGLIADPRRRYFVQTGLLAAAVLVLGGLTVRRNAHYHSGEALWTAAARQAPDNPRAHNNLGFYLVQQKRYDEAIARYRQALRINPDYAEAHANLGAALAAQGHSDAALDAYIRALELDADAAEHHVNIGLILAGKARLEAAAGHYTQALRLDSTLATAYANLGVVRIAQGQTEQARDLFARALQLDPALAEAHNNLGSILVGRGRLEEALPHYRRAIEHRPGYLDAHINLGIAQLWLHRPDPAEQHLRDALRLAPESPKAHQYLGTALLEQGRHAEAEVHFRRALDRVPRYAEAHCGLGMTLVRLDRTEEGRRHLQRALALKADCAEARPYLDGASAPGP